jgi:hypothetical protein
MIVKLRNLWIEAENTCNLGARYYFDVRVKNIDKIL